MKKYITWLAAGALALSAASCNDSFLQQDPIQELAEGSFLKNSGDLPLYLNGLYPSISQAIRAATPTTMWLLTLSRAAR